MPFRRRKLLSYAHSKQRVPDYHSEDPEHDKLLDEIMAMVQLRGPDRPFDAIRTDVRFHKRTECIAQGSILSSLVEALVDFCAGNLVSEAYLRELSVTIDHKQRNRIHRADGSVFLTLGCVVLPWVFREEEQVHELTFDVVPDSHTGAYPLILGGRFMVVTKTLSHFAHRINYRVQDVRVPCVMFQGQPQLRMMASCNGIRVAALPDTGSDVDLISPTMAEELRCKGVTVQMGPEHSITLELPGGALTRTLGVVRAVDFRFGKGDLMDRFPTDFHILPGLPAQVFLSNGLLDVADAFQMYHEAMIEAECVQQSELFLKIMRSHGNSGFPRRFKSFLLCKLRKQAPNDPSDESKHDTWRQQQAEMLNEVNALDHDDSLSQAEKDMAVARLKAFHRNQMSMRTADGSIT